MLIGIVGYEWRQQNLDQAQAITKNSEICGDRCRRVCFYMLDLTLPPVLFNGIKMIYVKFQKLF